MNLRRAALVALLVLGTGCGPAPSTPAPAPPSPTPAPAPTPDPGPITRSLRTVVVDPGHGGEDHGAAGVSGVLEKDVTLATARKLSKALRARGFTVIETRSEDVTVELARRTAIGNASQAGLFVSVHANSAPSDSARGIETYSMDLASDESALRLAERENRALQILSAAGAQHERLPDEVLVEELRHGANADWSRQLARSVHDEFVRASQGFYGRSAIKDRGHRSGPFWVLLDSEIPAILVELGYLTHAAEEQRVRSHAFQEQAAEAIAAGIEAWVERAEAAEAARPD